MTLNDLLLAFIPVFVAVDPIGLLPIFVSLTQGLTQAQKKKIITQSFGTALCLAFGFIFLGKAIFQYLGITVSDFMIAGGAILFCIAILDLLKPEKQRRLPPQESDAQELGAVPIGTPLIVGPAVLTTSLIVMDQHGVAATLMAVFVNILLTCLIFYTADLVIKFLGQAGSRALSKVMALLLAAIAVMMIRRGIQQFVCAG